MVTASMCFAARLPKLAVAFGCALILSSAGCTSTQTLYSGSGDAAATVLEPGDVVVVRLHDGRSIELTVLTWTAEHLAGIDRADTPRSIETGDIAELKLKRYSVGRTALLIGVGVAAVAMLQVASAYEALLGGG